MSKHFKKKRTWTWLEGLLVLSLFVLLGQVVAPALLPWWQRPVPGRLGIESLAEAYFLEGTTNCLAARYLASLPQEYGQSDSWPLVVFLHGSGQRGDDPEVLRQTGQMLSDTVARHLPAIAALPQCLPDHTWEPSDVIRFVEYCQQRYEIDPHRIYLVGYSLGSFGVQATVEKFADRFAAVVLIAGANSKSHPLELANVPIWVFHGALDEVIPVEESQKLVEAIRQVGGDPLITIFPDEGHGITQQVFKSPELWVWLREQNLDAREGESETKSITPGMVPNYE